MQDKIFKIERIDASYNYKNLIKRNSKAGRKSRFHKREMTIINQFKEKQISKLIEKQVMLHNEEKLLLEEQESSNETKFCIYVGEPKGKYSKYK